MMHCQYANRITDATIKSPRAVRINALAAHGEPASYVAMFDQHRFMAEVIREAGSQAEVGRTLGIPSSRVSEMCNPDAIKPRKLKLTEAVKLSETYGVPITGEMASAKSLLRVLKVALRHPPREWTDRELQRLASEIERGLQYLQALEPTPHEPDHLPPAADGEAQPSPDKPS